MIMEETYSHVNISLDSSEKHKSCTKSNQSLKVDADFGENDLIDERLDTSIDNKEQPYKQKQVFFKFKALLSSTCLFSLGIYISCIGIIDFKATNNFHYKHFRA
jgi:hypothetical protein